MCVCIYILYIYVYNIYTFTRKFSCEGCSEGMWWILGRAPMQTCDFSVNASWFSLNSHVSVGVFLRVCCVLLEHVSVGLLLGDCYINKTYLKTNKRI